MRLRNFTRPKLAGGPTYKPDWKILDLSRFVEEWGDPFDTLLWNLDEPITREEVQQAIDHETWEETPLDGEGDREYHIARVAYLAVHGWDDAIDLELGIPAAFHRPDWPVADGNHRLAAAIFRNDSTIVAECQGDERWIESFTLDWEDPDRDHSSPNHDFDNLNIIDDNNDI